MNRDTLSNKMRRLTLASIYEAKSGHPGGALSCIDLINLVICENINLKNPDDRFILSKGHAAPALYSAAYFNGWVELEELAKLRKINSILQGHPDVSKTPWVWSSTGSLGQGFSVAIGMSIGFKYKNFKNNTYVMIGDGELQEGEIWEGAMCAAHHKLDNLCLIIDYNKMQSDDLNKNIINVEPLKEKWQAFNWNVIEIDGHNFSQIEKGIEQFKMNAEMPTVIIANTIKGKGVSFMEEVPKWHGSVKIKDSELIQGLKDLGTDEQEIKSFLNGKIWSQNYK